MMERNRLGVGLKCGDTIGIIAPSAPLMTDEIRPICDFLQGLGYTVVLGQSVKESWGYLAGSDELRAADVNAFFADDHIHAILCLRGGYGAARLLPLLDYGQIAAHPKLFIGFSDITALHAVLRQRCHLATIHGPMATSFLRHPTAYTIAQFIRGLAQPIAAGPFPLPRRWQLHSLLAGTAHGILIGGNLSLVTSLAGTPYALEGSGCLLFLEEVSEEPYALDRLFLQLEQSGLISQVEGILFGQFSRCGSSKEAAYDFTVEQVIRYYVHKWNKPAIGGLPIGHGRQNGWLPLGVPAYLAGHVDGTAELIIDGKEAGI